MAILFPGRSVDNPYRTDSELANKEGVDEIVRAIPPQQVQAYRTSGRQPMQEITIFSVICDRLSSDPKYANVETVITNSNPFLKHASSALKRIRLRLLRQTTR